MSMIENEFKDRDEQAAWELLGRHKSVEPSFGFVERTLRRLEEPGTVARPVIWRLPAVRWAAAAGLAMALGVTGWMRWHAVESTPAADVYAAAVAQDLLEDFDVIAALDKLPGGSQL